MLHYQRYGAAGTHESSLGRKDDRQPSLHILVGATGQPNIAIRCILSSPERASLSTPIR